MTWDAEATIQLIGVLISILGIVIACYNHKSIIAANHWLYSMLPCHEHCSQTQKTKLRSQSLQSTSNEIRE